MRLPQLNSKNKRRCLAIVAIAIITRLLHFWGPLPEAGALEPPRPTVIAPNPNAAPCFQDPDKCNSVSILNIPGIDLTLLYRLNVLDVRILADDSNARATGVVMACPDLTTYANLNASEAGKIRRALLSLDKRVNGFDVNYVIVDGKDAILVFVHHSAIPRADTILLSNKLMKVGMKYPLCGVRAGPVMA